jgi:stage V sporulation protein G
MEMETIVDITEVRIKLSEVPNERLLAFCSITIDNSFVVRDLKIIEGTKGTFVAMPSRRLTDRCWSCKHKNHLAANYCNQCGEELDPDRADRDDYGKPILHADLAHPINSESRERLQTVILKAYDEEVEKSKHPGYRSTYDSWSG